MIHHLLIARKQQGPSWTELMAMALELMAMAPEPMAMMNVAGATPGKGAS